MIQNAQSLFVGAFSFAVFYSSGLLFRYIGGIVVFFLSVPVMIPRFGRWYHFTKRSLFAVTFAEKLIGYAINSSGILISVLIVRRHFPQMLDQGAFVIGLMFACLRTALGIMDDAHLMEIIDFEDATTTLKNTWLAPAIGSSGTPEAARQRLATFADVTMVNLLLIVQSYGMTMYGLARLGLIRGLTVSNESPIVFIYQSLSVIRFSTETLRSGGPWAAVVNVIFGGMIVYYTIFFISLSSKMIDVSTKKKEKDPYPDILEKLTDTIVDCREGIRAVYKRQEIR